jgi:hypothetical protein
MRLGAAAVNSGNAVVRPALRCRDESALAGGHQGAQQDRIISMVSERSPAHTDRAVDGGLTAKRLTIVLDDDELYAAVTAEATRLHRPLKDVVAEALREWLEALEDAELIPLVEESRADWEKHGGIEASELFRQLDAEAQSCASTV